MGRRGLTGLAATAVLAVAATVIATLARPARYEVEGLSMAPGLLPGDVVATPWFPRVDRRRPPRRFERWFVAVPGGGTGIKRVAGLPGERVSIRGGDLAIDGCTVLAGPAVLTETGSRLSGQGEFAATDAAGRKRGRWAWEPGTVFDDADFSARERRLLLPVHDVGLAAVVRVHPRPSADWPVRFSARVGRRRITWRIGGPGRFGVAAGRLDGHVVGVLWPLGAAETPAAADRSCLPPLPPHRWDVALPWDAEPAADGPSSTAEDHAPLLAFDVSPTDRGPVGAALVEAAWAWRDNLLRPAADGREEWQLAADEWFVLGDFPAGSRDSRHWGGLTGGAVLHRALVDAVAGRRGP